MDTNLLRQAFLSAPEKTQELVIPDWLKAVVEPDARILIKDIPDDEVGALRKENDVNPNGSNSLYGASLLCKCLVNATTQEPIFQPTDRDAIAHLGTTKLKPVYEQIMDFLGVTNTKEAVDNAKKN